MQQLQRSGRFDLKGVGQLVYSIRMECRSIISVGMKTIVHAVKKQEASATQCHTVTTTYVPHAHVHRHKVAL